MRDLEKIIKIIAYIGIYALFLTPFIITSNLYFPFIAGKAFFFRIIIEITFFSWIALVALNKEYRPKKSWLLIILTSFVFFLGVSNIFGEHPYFSFWSNYERMEGYINILHLFAYFLVISSVFKEKKDWIIFLTTSVAVSIGVNFLALQQFFGFKEVSQGVNRLDANFGNPIYLGVYNLFNVFFGLFLYFNDWLKGKWFKIALIIVTLLNAFVLFQTNTRGAILGLIGGVVVFALLNVFTISKKSPEGQDVYPKEKLIWKISLISVITIFVLSVGFLFVKDSDFVRSNKILSRFAEISLTSGTSAARLLNWQVALEGIKERPILGWGQGNYNYVFDKYYKPELHGNEVWFDHVHNIILDWFIAGGFIGFALYSLIIIFLLYSIWKAPDFSKLEKNIFIGLILGYLFQNLFVFDNQVSYILFFSLLAMFHSQRATNISWFEKDLSIRFGYAAVSISIILIPFSIYSLNAKAYFASTSSFSGYIDLVKAGSENITKEQATELIKSGIEKSKKATAYNSFGNSEIRQRILDYAYQVSRLPDDALDPSIKKDFIDFSISEAFDQVNKYPNNAFYSYVLGINLARYGDAENSEFFLKKTIELSPNKQATRIPLARLYATIGKKDEALALAKETYELDPSKDDLWVEYAIIANNLDKELYDQLFQDAISEEKYSRLEKLISSEVQSNPDNIQAYVDLSAFYFKIGRKEDSVKVLEDVIKKFPDSESQINQLIESIKSGENPIGKNF